MADCENHRIASFALDGTPQHSFGRLGLAPGEFRNPSDVAIALNRLVVPAGVFVKIKA